MSEGVGAGVNWRGCRRRAVVQVGLVRPAFGETNEVFKDVDTLRTWGSSIKRGASPSLSGKFAWVRLSEIVVVF